MEFFFVFGSWAGDPVKVGRDTFHPYIGAMGRLQSEGMLLTLAFVKDIFDIIGQSFDKMHFTCNWVELRWV